MLVRIVGWGWLIGMWLLPPIAFAASGTELFAQGVQAFKSGNYSSALRYFEQARTAGLDIPTLHYNLGVSLYKLGRYAEAEQAFRACARDPAWAALAYYNAGLSAYQRGQRTEAAAHFDRAWRTADDNEVRALAFTMLERIDAAASRRPRGALALNAGHNDNVTLTADSLTLQTSSESDRFIELLASVDGRWSTGAGTVRWDASLYNLDYAQLTENNITALLLGAAKPAAIASWHTEWGVQWEYVLRDGHRFQQAASAQFLALRDRPNGGDLRLSAQMSAIDALDDNFALLDGSQQRLAVSAGQRAGSGHVRLGVRYERNNRADLTTSNEFFSFSPTRYGLSFNGAWPLNAYWQLGPAARFMRSRYADPDRRASGVTATREDDELQLSLRARYRFAIAWRLVGEYSYIDNRSNFPEFSYSQRIISVGVTRMF